MEDRFATELLHEVKESAKRWFIAFIAVLVCWVLTIGLFIWYISLPVEEYSEGYIQNADNNSFNQLMKGDMYNGGKAISEDILQETSNQE